MMTLVYAIFISLFFLTLLFLGLAVFLFFYLDIFQALREISGRSETVKEKMFSDEVEGGVSYERRKSVQKDRVFFYDHGHCHDRKREDDPGKGRG